MYNLSFTLLIIFLKLTFLNSSNLAQQNASVINGTLLSQLCKDLNCAEKITILDNCKTKLKLSDPIYFKIYFAEPKLYTESKINIIGVNFNVLNGNVKNAELVKD